MLICDSRGRTTLPTGWNHHPSMFISQMLYQAIYHAGCNKCCFYHARHSGYLPNMVICHSCGRNILPAGWNHHPFMSIGQVLYEAIYHAGCNKHCFYCARHLGNLPNMFICHSRGQNTLPAGVNHLPFMSISQMLY